MRDQGQVKEVCDPCETIFVCNYLFLSPGANVMIKNRRSRPERTAFTLVELLVVIAIIGVLVGLLLPAVQAAREAARRMSCSNNLKQVGIALHNYHDTHKTFPPSSLTSNRLAWTVHVLPFLEQKPLHDQFDFSRHYNQTPNHILGMTAVSSYHCPSTKIPRSSIGNGGERIGGVGTYTTHYYGVLGPKGINPQTGAAYPFSNVGGHGGFALSGLFKQNDTKKFAHVTDGTSNTFAIGEISWDDRGGNRSRYRTWSRGHQQNQWTAPAKNLAHQINSDFTADFNDMSFGSNHPGGCHFLMADASVQFIAETTDFGRLLASASVDGREIEVAQ